MVFLKTIDAKKRVIGVERYNKEDQIADKHQGVCYIVITFSFVVPMMHIKHIEWVGYTKVDLLEILK